MHLSRQAYSPAVAFCIGLLLFAFTQNANAQNVSRQNAYVSPQTFAVELRAGPYIPNVDGAFSGAAADRPYAQYFGNKSHIMFQGEFDYQFFQGFGTLAAGLSVGYMTQSSQSYVEPQGGPVSVRSGDKTALAIFPVGVSLVYRFDPLARHYHIPLVPYGKAGLDYVFWRTTTDQGGTEDPIGPGKGLGATPGWHVALGVSLLLDQLDPGSAQELDSETGINHTYLFVELQHNDFSGFGSNGSIWLGDDTWQAGMMFEF